MRRTFLAFGLLGCHRVDTDSDVDASPCARATAAFGARVCVDAVPDGATWTSITLPSGGEIARVTKFVAPARDDARVATFFQDANTFQLHYDALSKGFPEAFAGVTPVQYLDLVLDPVDRELYVGDVEELRTIDGASYAFTVLDDAAVASSTITEADVIAVHDALAERWGLSALAFRPNTPHQQLASARWELPFPIVGLSPVAYEAYSTGVGFGTVRHFDPVAFAAAEQSASYGFQDLLFLDETPVDVERPISGAVTGTRQAPLSHLAVRSAARGTPDCYVADLSTLVAQWDGQLVRMECGATALDVRAATVEEAAAYWATLRPSPVAVDPPDVGDAPMIGLLAMPVTDAAARDLGRRRYGGKATNLALLYQGIDPGLRLAGFAIPMRAYDAFVHTAGFTVDLGDGPRLHTFAEAIDAWHQDPVFLADAVVRRQRLDALRTAMKAAPIGPALLAEVGEAVQATWGNTTTTVRFRSSSNAEDALAFSGAGLYDSASGCIADDLDGDAAGPSKCDVDRASERTVEDALREVWASLWTTRAWEERAWYGIDGRDVAMAVLVNTRTEGERANLVAFTGDPRSQDDRTRIDAQAGENEVVSSDPDVIPESLFVEVVDGNVVDVDRITWSTEVPFGTAVLTDAEVATVATSLWGVAQWFPIDEVVPDGHEVLWDTEWKVEADGRVIIKQIRPFLR